MARWVLHVDLDQFLAAVEVLRRPELRGLPVIVGGRGDPAERAVVSTASYEARAFGVRSGMPLRTAVKKCPDAVLLPVDKPVYEEVSATVMATLRSVAQVVEVLGWDEAFLGVVTDDPESVARTVQRRVQEETALDCSVGIGRNKLQAKIATSYGKPAGVYRLTAENWFSLLGDRPPDALWGVGAKTAKKLAGLGITTVRQLADADDPALAAAFGPNIGPWLGRLGRGEDRSPVVGDPWVARSRSRETTFQQDLTDWDDVRREVAALARVVADDVAAEGRPAIRVVVKLRTRTFFTSTHGVKLPAPTSTPAGIEAGALSALSRFEERRPIRLIGVRAEFAGGSTSTLSPPPTSRG